MYDNNQPMALHIIDSLCEQGVDVAHSKYYKEGQSITHAVQFVTARILGGKQVPVLPVIQNTYFPPNQPRPRRSYEFGVAIRNAVESFKGDLRVGIIASGGLSHFVVDEELDRSALKAMKEKDAAKLAKQAVLFSDFLLTRSTWQPRALDVKAIVHGHCHQKSLLGMTGETRLLKKLGVEFKLLDSGCCGMAGSFGFKPEHYEVSIAAGEKGGLLPAVRAASADTLIISNGYSCREQIAQTGGRRALHIAEVARMALEDED